MRNLKDIRQMLSDCRASIVGTKKDKELTRIIKDNEIPLGKVNAVKYKTGLFMGEVEIWDGASMFKVKNILKKTLIPFVNAVNETIGEFEKSQKSSGSSVADEIIKLKKLMDEGVITRNEFEKKKNELLK